MTSSSYDISTFDVTCKGSSKPHVEHYSVLDPDTLNYLVLRLGGGDNLSDNPEDYIVKMGNHEVPVTEVNGRLITVEVV